MPDVAPLDDLSTVADALTAVVNAPTRVTIRHRQSGAERIVRRASLPFFTNQGYELVADEPAPAPETPGRHEAPEPADAADPGASTTPTPDTTSTEEN